MITSAIYHRPESEYAFLYDNETIHIRLRTARGDVKGVNLLHTDTYRLHTEGWYDEPIKMKRYLTTDIYDYWVAAATAEFHRIGYGFEVIGLDGTKVLYGDHGIFPYEEKYLQMPNNYFRLPYFHEADRVKVPEWVKKTVWYQIFPERFANGDTTNDPDGTLPWGSKAPDRQDFFGGDLQGVIDHLDHLEELGINGIYFCPVFEAFSNHKYDTIDYMEIDPAFGDKALFKKLVEECHKRGIKVMLDAVFNHIGDTSPQWKDVMKNGADSKYADWFHIHEFPVSYKEGKNFEDAYDITYDVFAFTPHMPKLNTANPEVKAYLLEIARYWIEEFDIDAWRLDVANEVDHQFWKDFRKVCDAAKEDFYILGEIWNSSQSWLNGDEFHAVMNYAYTDAIMEYFVKDEIPMSKMVSEINSQLMLYRDQTNQVQFNVLDSHDTPRLLTQAKGDKDLAKQVLAFTYLQPGVPCIYYGDEYSMTGDMDPDCRKCMVWEEDEQDQDMFEFFQNLVRFRKDYQPILSEGELKWRKVCEDCGVIKLSRDLAGASVLGIFNSGNETKEIGVEGEVLLSNQAAVKDGKALIAPKGFVLMK